MEFETNQDLHMVHLLKFLSARVGRKKQSAEDRQVYVCGRMAVTELVTETVGKGSCNIRRYSKAQVGKNMQPANISADVHEFVQEFVSRIACLELTVWKKKTKIHNYKSVCRPQYSIPLDHTK